MSLPWLKHLPMNATILKTVRLSLGTAVALASIGITLLPGAGQALSGPSFTLAQTPETTPGSTPSASTDARFGCQLVDGQYTVMYYPQSQPGQAYPWAIPAEMGGGWTPERRCVEIGRRLEMYRPDGLQEMRTGLENGYNTVCVTTQQSPGCRIVFTVPPGQDPAMTRDRVFENLTVADSGQQTDGVNTFSGDSQNDLIGRIGAALDINLPNIGGRIGGSRRSDSINLRPFLDRADGGTGDRLQGGVSTNVSPRLNPDRFR